MRVLARTLFVVLCLLAAPNAWADAQQQLDLAVTRYQNGRYEEAADILSKLLSVRVDPSTPEGSERRGVNLRARPYYVATLHALGRLDEAQSTALAQYRDDPFYELPAGQFPPPVSDLFIVVEAQNRDEIEALREKMVADKQKLAAQRAKLEKARAERLRELERLASEEVAIIERSRWIAAIPFGVGQFQNGDTGLGIFFAVTETLAIGSAVASASIAWDLKMTDCFEPSASPPENAERCAAVGNFFQTALIVNWASLGTAGALAIAGIIEAQVSFEEETVRKKKREIPPPVVPEAVVTQEGAYFGLRGRF